MLFSVVFIFFFHLDYAVYLVFIVKIIPSPFYKSPEGEFKMEKSRFASLTFTIVQNNNIFFIFEKNKNKTSTIILTTSAISR